MDEHADILLELVLSSPRRPVLVGIDGQGGAGKSTLAGMLSGMLTERASVVDGDVFYSDIRWAERATFTPAEAYARNFDWRRLRDQVLLPVRADAPVLRYQRYDWDQQKMGDWIEQPVPTVVIVEGVYMLRSQLRDLFDVKVFVQATRETRLSRMRARHATYDRAHRDASNHRIQGWVAAEELYIAETDPLAQADFVIDADDPLDE